MTTDTDRQLRKQLVLARIAADRLEWHGELDDLMHAANPRSLWPSMVRAAFGPGWLSNLLGGGTRPEGPPGPAQGLGTHLLDGLTLLRRYPVLLTLAGSALAWLRTERGATAAGSALPWFRAAPRRRMRRVALLVGVGAAVAGSTWFVLARWRRRARVR